MGVGGSLCAVHLWSEGVVGKESVLETADGRPALRTLRLLHRTTAVTDHVQVPSTGAVTPHRPPRV